MLSPRRSTRLATLGTSDAPSLYPVESSPRRRNGAASPQPASTKAKATAKPSRSTPSSSAAETSTYLSQIDLLKRAPLTPARLAVAGGTVAAVVLACRHLELDTPVTAAVVVTAVVCSLFMLLVGPIPQDKEYHNFADRRGLLCTCGLPAGAADGHVPHDGAGRPFLRIPNFGDVVSTFPFIVVGGVGAGLLRGWAGVGPAIGVDPASIDMASVWEREIAWPAFFVSIALVSIGSAYYHWKPSNATLVWDRLPMTLAFMAVFAIMLEERLGRGIGEATLVPLLVVGCASVVYWDRTDDLRPYILVQVVPLAAIPLLIYFYPARYTGASYELWGLIWYGIAKVVEALDIQVRGGGDESRMGGWEEAT